jgi:micrococcal nuclease
MADCRMMIVLTLLASTLASAPAPCSLPIIEQADVDHVDSMGAIVLKDGRSVRLAAVLPPRPGEPLAAEAHQHLSVAVIGKSIGLALDERATDRHGALVAHVFVADRWLQQGLIDGGLARVRTSADTATCAATLLAAEKTARDAKRGLWSLPHYQVRTAETLDADIGTFQIVEGKVTSVATSKGRAFVNFGADYRTDFTVTIGARDLRRLANEGIDPATWAGKQIRVRGWLSRLNGPEVELTHAAQIQIIE